MRTSAKGGRGGWSNADTSRQGGRGYEKESIFADVLYGRPLRLIPSLLIHCLIWATDWLDKSKRTHLSVVPALEYASVFVKFLSNSCTIDFHAGSKDDQVIPLADLNRQSNWFIELWTLFKILACWKNCPIFTSFGKSFVRCYPKKMMTI